VYNAEKFIKANLITLFNQLTSDVEVIIINDGSKDLTIDQLENAIHSTRYKDNICLITQNNRGVSSARNTGLTKASGRFIAFIDADDFVRHDYIKNILSLLEDDCLLIFNHANFNGSTFQKNGNSFLNEIILHDQTKLWEDFFNQSILDFRLNTIWNKVYLRKRLNEEKILFEEGLTLGEDLLFNLRYLKGMPSLKFSNEAIYFYQNATINSLSKKRGVLLIDTQVKLLHALVVFLSDHNLTLRRKTGQFLLKTILYSLIYIFSPHSMLLSNEKKIIFKRVMNHIDVKTLLSFKFASTLQSWLFVLFKGIFNLNSLYTYYGWNAKIYFWIQEVHHKKAKKDWSGDIN
jgi:glycosyltransferase involved in cell wall biosynthesis